MISLFLFKRKGLTLLIKYEIFQVQYDVSFRKELNPRRKKKIKKFSKNQEKLVDFFLITCYWSRVTPLKYITTLKSIAKGKVEK